VPLLVEQEQPRRPHPRHPAHRPGVVDPAVGEVLERLVGEQDVQEVQGGLGVGGVDGVDEAVHPVDLVELEVAEVGLGAGAVGAAWLRVGSSPTVAGSTSLSRGEVMVRYSLAVCLATVVNPERVPVWPHRSGGQSWVTVSKTFSHSPAAGASTITATSSRIWGPVGAVEQEEVGGLAGHVQQRLGDGQPGQGEQLGQGPPQPARHRAAEHHHAPGTPGAPGGHLAGHAPHRHRPALVPPARGQAPRTGAGQDRGTLPPASGTGAAAPSRASSVRPRGDSR
jgi:hypothetical protein